MLFRALARAVETHAEPSQPGRALIARAYAQARRPDKVRLYVAAHRQAYCAHPLMMPAPRTRSRDRFRDPGSAGLPGNAGALSQPLAPQFATGRKQP